MDAFFNYLKNNIVKVTVMLVIVCCVVYIVSDTYAASGYTIVFNRAEGTEILKTCETDANGKINQECMDSIDGWCDDWSLDKWNGGSHVQSNPIQSYEFANVTFTKDENYYCYAGSSGTYYPGCYICKADSSIMHWSSNANATTDCPGGYNKSTTITTEEECKVYACYECSDNKNYMEWRYSAISDNNCPAGYNRTTKTQEECKPIIPDSCYVCKTDSNVMKWDNNGDGDSNCSSGYEPINKPQSECKPIIPEACYECKTDKNIMKWDNNGNADIKCAAGYNKVNKTEAECVPVDNPKTGNIMMFAVWVIGLGAICYSVYYLKRLADNI